VPRKNRARGPKKTRKTTEFSRELAAFGERVRAHRKERGLTIEQLAEAADLSNNHVSEIERAKSNPRLDTIDAIAEALGVSTRALVEGRRGDVEILGAKGREFAAMFDALPTDLQESIVLLLYPHAIRRDPP
jgi:transcriptional regulator with XRE-family HTH domain